MRVIPVLLFCACPPGSPEDIATNDTDRDADSDTDADTDDTDTDDTDTDTPDTDGEFPADDGEVDVVLDGGSDAPRVGAALAVADLDGDGIDDLLVGAPYETFDAVNDGGRVWLEYGPVSASGTLDAVADAWFDGEGPLDHLGSQLGVLGDLDGDGRVDVAALAEDWPSTISPPQGRTYLEFGGPVRHAGGAVITAWDASVTGSDPFALAQRLGHGVTGIGDLDQDGFDDVALADPEYEVDVGRIYFVGGSVVRPLGDVPSESIYFTIDGTDGDDVCSERCLAGDDFDGDGAVDLAIASDNVKLGKRRVYLRYGDGTFPMAETTGFYPMLEGFSDEEGFGRATAAVGDLDGDGYPELAVANELDDMSTDNGGRLWVIRGDAVRWIGTASLDSTAWLTIEGVQTAGLVGSAVLGLGDVDLDGFGDFLVGSASADGLQPLAGSVTLWLAPEGGTKSLTDASATLRGGIGEQGFGASIATGDLDGDVVPDLVVGAPAYSSDTGRVYVFLDAF